MGVLAISSPVPQPLLDAGLDRLRAAGLEPVVYPSAREPGRERDYLAGSDELRMADLVDALTDDSIAGIVFARGGVGAQRTLAALDWTCLEGVAPKLLAGFSDVTALLEAVAVRLGWASVHSAMVAGGDPHTDYSFGALLRMITAPQDVSVLRFPDATTVVGGRGSGVTLGGNLCLLTASIGTPTSRPAAGGILLLEDESEADYRIDRMLTQLLRSGYLDGVAGIVTGWFHGCGPPEVIGAILAERLGALGVPMISWADVGHGGPNQPFPIGVAAELDADACTLRLLDPPLVPTAGP